MTEYGSWSDEELVVACNSGDAAAFDALYLRYRDWSVRLAYRFTGDSAEALDVAQESFAYLLSRFPGFTMTARMTSFLYVVVKHNALSARRRARRRPPAAATEAPGPAGPESVETSAALAAAVARLPDAHREVLLMRFVDDMSMEEIGAALSIPLGTVKSRLHYALAALRADPDAGACFHQG